MLEWLTLQSCALAAGFLIDFIIGDPHGLPHPVVGIGRMISCLDGKLRRGDSNPKDMGRGIATVVLVCLASTLIPTAVLVGCYLLHPIAYFCVDSIMCWQLLAARQLERESKAVQKALEEDDVEGAREERAFRMWINSLGLTDENGDPGRDTEAHGKDRGAISAQRIKTRLTKADLTGVTEEQIQPGNGNGINADIIQDHGQIALPQHKTAGNSDSNDADDRK